MDPRADRLLRRSAIVVIGVLLTVVSLTSVVLSNASWRDRARRQLGWTTQFEVSAASGLPPEWHQRATLTVVIFLSGTCDACRLSLPFHRALRAAAEAAGLRVVTALTALNDDPASYAAAEQLRATDVVRFDFRGSRLQRVPTILLIDPQGVVVEMKEGVLPNDEQHALIARLWSLR